jgi:hypothetical protein
MPDAKGAASERESEPDAEAEAEALDPTSARERALQGDALDLDGLRTRGDVEGLLSLAKACRAGSVPGGRDMKKCYAAYRAAAELGSGDAEYAVALFCMSGGVVAQDLKEGSTRLRSAAEKGSVPAKVYLGNLYELGIFYKADAEKADVWYRNAARGARITSEPGSPEYGRELAELGCARYVTQLTNGTELDEAEKTRLLQRAKAHGLGLRMKDETGREGDRPTFLNALADAEGSARTTTPQTTPRATTKNPTDAADKPAPAEAKRAAEADADAKDAGPSRASLGLSAFGYALLFLLAGLGAGYAAAIGARELVAHGHPLPGIGTRTELVFPIVFGAIGVLPTTLVYRFVTVLKAIVMGGAMAGIGWVAWGTGQGELHGHRAIQAGAFGIAGFIAGLLVLGLLGGTKASRTDFRRLKRRHPTG